jgi:NAD(P)-dependent dehydrogenase (short-subunit alcohol dehydrogenase family)
MAASAVGGSGHVSGPESWRLDGRVALVTGAQRGIGFACAEAFVAAGASVVCVDLPGGTLEAAVERLGPAASAHAADIAEVDGAGDLVEEVVGRHGRLDILVNAAGTLSPAPFLEMTTEQWDRTLDVNTRGTLFLAQACARHFVSTETRGRIILFASIVGRSVVRLNNTAYSASKAALIQAARCLALELAPHGITVNTICPTVVYTPMLDHLMTLGQAYFQDVGRLCGSSTVFPGLDALDVRDVSEAVLWLASPAARYITGIALPVDGGFTCK